MGYIAPAYPSSLVSSGSCLSVVFISWSACSAVQALSTSRRQARLRVRAPPAVHPPWLGRARSIISAIQVILPKASLACGPPCFFILLYFRISAIDPSITSSYLPSVAYSGHHCEVLSAVQLPSHAADLESQPTRLLYTSPDKAFLHLVSYDAPQSPSFLVKYFASPFTFLLSSDRTFSGTTVSTYLRLVLTCFSLLQTATLRQHLVAILPNN